MKKSVQMTICGRVQNVGFRYNTQITANDYNISGFVKNMSNGCVYIEAEGEESDLEKFVEWCKKGPAWSNVDNVNVEYTPLNNYKGFKIR